MKKVEAREKNRIQAADWKIIRQFYELVEETYKNSKIEKGYQIINIDETELTIGREGEISIEKKGKSGSVITDNGKEHVTIIGCANAMGHYFAPSFIFQAKKSINAEVLRSGSSECTVLISESGWIKLFFEWFKVIEPHLPSARPIICFLDGHLSHLYSPFLEWAVTKQIEVVCFPAHTTDLIQPLDVSFFWERGQSQ